MIRPAYTYRCKVVSVYDGDTMTVDIDLGCFTWVRNQKLRLYGIDTPEVRGEERPQGLEVRDYVRERVAEAEEIIIQTRKDAQGKFGRWLATVYLDGINLNTQLVKKGMAKEYYGGKR